MRRRRRNQKKKRRAAKRHYNKYKTTEYFPELYEGTEEAISGRAVEASEQDGSRTTKGAATPEGEVFRAAHIGENRYRRDVEVKRSGEFLQDSRIQAPHATPAGVRDDSASAR